MSALRFFVGILISALTLVIWVHPIAAQSKSPRDPVEIQRKVQRSAELQRQALQALGNPAQADRIIGSAYASLKSAQDDMVVNASNAKAPDPLLGLNMKKAEQALGLVLGAQDAFRGGVENPAEVARERLQQALRVTNTLLATGF
jgi:hypothetical protein